MKRQIIIEDEEIETLRKICFLAIKKLRHDYNKENIVEWSDKNMLKMHELAANACGGGPIDEYWKSVEIPKER
jgi:hypothetical protein